ncbi:MAG: glycosyltransferase [Bacteroidota bacterium]
MSNPNLPLVSVICLCYNHQNYVRDAIDSVWQQTYPNIELIVVDDASEDNSQIVIKDHLIDRDDIKFIALKENLGNCSAFNKGWRESSGEFIIDLAADDLLLPERVAKGVEQLQLKGKEYGVHFSDAKLIDRGGKHIGDHLTANFFNDSVPEGYLFTNLLEKYFINPVSMMYSRELLAYLGGYDETLTYEDFDLWVRSSKKFKYCYSNEVLVAKRLLSSSHSTGQYNPGSNILKSTYRVCKKALDICETSDEYKALVVRINFEMKQAAFSFNWSVVKDFFFLKRKVKKILKL